MVVTKIDDLATVFKKHLPEVIDQEIVMIAYMATSSEVIDSEIIFMGGLDRSTVDPRVIFSRALRRNAACIALAHTHPSGNTTPSSLDKTVTKRIIDGGHILNIELLDHLIFGSHDDYLSIMTLDNFLFV